MAKERVRAEALYDVAVGPARGVVGHGSNVVPKLLVPRFDVFGINQIGQYDTPLFFEMRDVFFC